MKKKKTYKRNLHHHHLTNQQADRQVNAIFACSGKQWRCNVVYLTNKLVCAAGPVQN